MEDTLTIEPEVIQQQPVLEQQAPPQDPPSKQLWQKLYDSKAYTNSYEDFQKKYSTPESIGMLHQKLSAAKAYTNSIDDFYVKYFPEKKSSAAPNGLQNGAPKPTTTSVPSTSPLPEGEFHAPLTDPNKENEGLIDVKAEAAKFEAANPDHSIYDSYNPIDLYEQANTLLQPTEEIATGIGAGEGMVSIPATKEARDKANSIKENLKKRGLEPNNFKILSDFPKEWYNIPGFTKDEIVSGLKTNPYRTTTKIASAKWQIPIQEAILKKSNSDEELAAFKENRDLFASEESDYKTKRSAAKYLITQIRANGGDNMDKLLENFAISAAEVYGSVPDNHPDIQAQYLKYPHLDPAQIKYLNYLQDAVPYKAYAYRDALISPTKLEGNPDMQTGQEERLKRFEEGGIAMRENFLNGKLRVLEGKFNELLQVPALTPEQTELKAQIQSSGAAIEEELDNLKLQANELLIKYPKAGVNEAELQAQELLGQRHTGLNWMALETGRATGNAVNSIWDFVSEPFRSDENSLMHGLETLGDFKNTQSSTYLTQDKQISPTFTPKVSEQLQPIVDLVKNDKSLSEKEKRMELTKILMQNRDMWQQQPIEDGRTNLGITSLLYGTGGLAANLAPFMLASYFTGGGATATFARKFTSGFSSMLGTAFHETYAAALDAGERNPYAYAFRSTAINAAAMAGAGTPAQIRKMLGGVDKQIGTIVNKLTDKQILKILRNTPASMSTFRKGLDLAKGAGQGVIAATVQGGKSAIHITPWITGGQVINEVMDDHAINWQDHGKQAAIEALKFTILGGIGGSISKGLGFARNQYLGRTNEIGKATLYTAASQPKAWLEALQQKEDNGAISKEDADQIRVNISVAHDVLKNVPMVDATGKKLNDRGKRDLLFLKMQEKDLTETMHKDLPPDLKIKMKERLDDVHDKIDKVYKGVLMNEDDLGAETIKLLGRDDITSLYIVGRSDPALFKEFGYSTNVNGVLSMADAYHKAQADGKNPALVKKIDDILNKQEEVDELTAEEIKPKAAAAFGVGLSHGDWLDKNKSEFSTEDYNRLNDALVSTDETVKKNAVNEIVAKKEELKNGAPLTEPEKKEWNNLSMQEKLQLATENLPEIESLSELEIIKEADTNAKFLLAKRQGEIAAEPTLETIDVKDKATAAFGKKTPTATEEVEPAPKQLSREEALAEIRADLPDADNLTRREIADIADKRARELQAAKNPPKAEPAVEPAVEAAKDLFTPEQIKELKEKELTRDKYIKSVDVIDAVTGEPMLTKNKKPVTSRYAIENLRNRHSLLENLILNCL